MSIKRIAKQALSAYARSKTHGRKTAYSSTYGGPVRNRPIRTTRVKRGRSMESQIASKAARALRRAF